MTWLHLFEVRSLDSVWWVRNVAHSWLIFSFASTSSFGSALMSHTERAHWRIIRIMLRVQPRLSLEPQPVTVQIYCLSTQWENIDLLSLSHLISCTGDSAFHLSPWQRKWGKHSNSVFLPSNEALERCGLITSGKPLSKQEWTSLSLMVYHWHLSAQLASAKSQCLTAFLAAECAAAWEWCTPAIPLWFYSSAQWDLSVYVQRRWFTPFAFVGERSSLKRSAAARNVSQVIMRAPCV